MKKILPLQNHKQLQENLLKLNQDPMICVLDDAILVFNHPQTMPSQTKELLSNIPTCPVIFPQANFKEITPAGNFISLNLLSPFSELPFESLCLVLNTKHLPAKLMKNRLIDHLLTHAKNSFPNRHLVILEDITYSPQKGTTSTKGQTGTSTLITTPTGQTFVFKETKAKKPNIIQSGHKEEVTPIFVNKDEETINQFKAIINRSYWNTDNVYLIYETEHPEAAKELQKHLKNYQTKRVQENATLPKHFPPNTKTYPPRYATTLTEEPLTETAKEVSKAYFETFKKINNGEQVTAEAMKRFYQFPALMLTPYLEKATTRAIYYSLPPQQRTILENLKKLATEKESNKEKPKFIKNTTSFFSSRKRF